MTKPTVSLPFQKDGRSRPSLLLKTCMPSLYRIRHPYHTTFVLVIVPHSLPLSYHFRHPYHTTFVLPNIFNHLSIKQFQNFPVFPTFPVFPAFPEFPTFLDFHDFHEFPPFPTIPKKIIHPQCPTHPQPRSARGDGAARVTKWRAVPLDSTTRPNFNTLILKRSVAILSPQGGNSVAKLWVVLRTSIISERSEAFRSFLSFLRLFCSIQTNQINQTNP